MQEWAVSIIINIIMYRNMSKSSNKYVIFIKKLNYQTHMVTKKHKNAQYVKKNVSFVFL